MTRREFGATGVGSAFALGVAKPSWIAVDRNGVSLHSAYQDCDRAVNTGSLLKPFLALAYLRAGSVPFSLTCRGSGDGCWKPDGHGRLTLPEAIGHSCNAYFLRLAGEANRAALDLVCLSYGLIAPDRELNPGRLIGLGRGWPQAPRAIVQAFARLSSDSHRPDTVPVLSGMALCAQTGTAKAVGMNCYAKTGTAPCAHAHGGVGDGYAVAIAPLKCTAVLVMMHNTTGARAAGAVKSIAGDALA